MLGQDPVVPSPKKDFFADYRSYADIVTRMRSYQSTPSLNITMPIIARSHERRDIYVVRLRVASDRPPQEKIWISCGQHAREWVAPAACLYVLDRLRGGYGSDERLSRLLDKYEVLVAPLINPDGYEYSRTSYRYWRKNRRRNGPLSYGVDLNRNWPGRWGDVGRSANGGD